MIHTVSSPSVLWSELVETLVGYGQGQLPSVFFGNKSKDDYQMLQCPTVPMPSRFRITVLCFFVLRRQVGR